MALVVYSVDTDAGPRTLTVYTISTDSGEDTLTLTGLPGHRVYPGDLLEVTASTTAPGGVSWSVEPPLEIVSSDLFHASIVVRGALPVGSAVLPSSVSANTGEVQASESVSVVPQVSWSLSGGAWAAGGAEPAETFENQQ